jgi:signal transduction histidine kinase
MQPLGSLPIAVEQDVVTARQRARDVARALGLEAQDQARVATAVSEIARNALRYARGGRCEFAVEGERPPQTLAIRIRDQEPGIAHLDAVIEGRYGPATGMGIGLVGAQRLVDACDIRTGPGGTEITLRKLLPLRARALDMAEIAAVAGCLTRPEPSNPYEELRAQHRDLLQALADLRERQEELLRVNRELEDTNRGVVALYAELDEKADHLRRADEMKTRFLSNMSHEFRTPLNSIRALSGLLLDHADGPLTGEQETQVGFIRKAAEDLSSLVEDLLDIAKIEAGRIEMHCAEVSVDNLFSALRGMLRPLLVAESVVLRFDAAADLPMLVTDEAKLSQVLRNFISNALKFTERGEVRVEATHDASDDTVRFAVTDTGIGIDAAHRDAIFEEFVQVQGPLQRRTPGTGLGLPLCRRLAALLGGRVEVQSEPGVGSCFALILPRLYPGEAAVPAAAPVPSRAADAAGSRVLVIEDDEATRYTLRRLLDTARYRVLEASDGRSGLDAARAARPELILLDLGLPDVDGEEVLLRLEADEATRDIPVVIATARDLSSHERTRLRERTRGVLSKRELEDNLVAVVAATLRDAAQPLRDA